MNRNGLQAYRSHVQPGARLREGRSPGGHDPVGEVHRARIAAGHRERLGRRRAPASEEAQVADQGLAPAAAGVDILRAPRPRECMPGRAAATSIMITMPSRIREIAWTS